MRYGGLCDCHGVESFVLLDDIETVVDEGARERHNHLLSSIAMRAKFNRQRAAMVYAIDLNPDEVKYVEGLLEDGKFEDALRWMKRHPTFVVERKARGALKIIPNKDLDFGW